MEKDSQRGQQIWLQGRCLSLVSCRDLVRARTRFQDQLDSMVDVGHSWLYADDSGDNNRGRRKAGKGQPNRPLYLPPSHCPVSPSQGPGSRREQILWEMVSKRKLKMLLTIL